MNKFRYYLRYTVIHPEKSFRQLLRDPNSLRYGARAIFLIALLYTLTVVGLAIGHAPITTPPAVAIPANDYYVWESFFTLPAFVLLWILAAGVAHLVSKWFKGSGTFEGTAAVLGFAIALPLFVTWSVETVATMLILARVMRPGAWAELITHPGFWQVFTYAYQLVAYSWYLLLVPLAVRTAHQLRWWQALVVGLLTLLVAGLLVSLFIR